MTRRARAYIWVIMLLGAALDGLSLAGMRGTSTGLWLTGGVLVLAATIAQLRTTQIDGHTATHLTPVFIFAGVLLLPAGLLVPLAIVPALAEWGKERRSRQAPTRRWWIHPFNGAMYSIMVVGAHAACTLLANGSTHLSPLAPSRAAAAAVAALTFVALNYGVGGSFLVIVRDMSWRDTGLLDRDNLAIELSLVGLGCAVAALWQAAPWFVPAVFLPVALTYRALAIPKLRRESRIDSKTGLATARYFYVLFAAELDRARRFDRPLALLMADLDNFKAVNDTHGHLAGDAVLAAVGKVLRASLREYDIAGRFGGEEFAIVLTETDPEAARHAAECIRRAISTERFALAHGPTRLSVTLSIGGASFPYDGDTPTALIRAADSAAYCAKASGRNCIVWASEPEPVYAASRADRRQTA